MFYFMVLFFSSKELIKGFFILYEFHILTLRNKNLLINPFIPFLFLLLSPLLPPPPPHPPDRSFFSPEIIFIFYFFFSINEFVFISRLKRNCIEYAVSLIYKTLQLALLVERRVIPLLLSDFSVLRHGASINGRTSRAPPCGCATRS